jgi:hypothetical protein
MKTINNAWIQSLGALAVNRDRRARLLGHGGRAWAAPQRRLDA